MSEIRSESGSKFVRLSALATRRTGRARIRAGGSSARFEDELLDAVITELLRHGMEKFLTSKRAEFVVMGGRSHFDQQFSATPTNRPSLPGELGPNRPPPGGEDSFAIVIALQPVLASELGDELVQVDRSAAFAADFRRRIRPELALRHRP